ncbi:MAG: S8 family serine peptidase, partial [Planctomycetota bacterium]|nr:S8 family serine peptidase [Planctomycetota bacterium]
MARFAWLLLVCWLAACSQSSSPPEDDGVQVPAPDPDEGEDDTPETELDDPHVAGEVLLAMRDPDDDEEIAEILAEFAGQHIERIGASFFLLDVDDGTDLQEILEDLDSDLRVVDTEPNYIAESPEGGPGTIKILGGDLLSAIPAQPAYAALDLAAAHGLSTGAGVVVAVIDTGLDHDHPLFAGRIAGGGIDLLDQDEDPQEERNFFDDDDDGLVDEQYGHGTFIASQILAVAPDARILPIRILNDDGFTTAALLAAGIQYAVNSGAQVINISVSLPRKSNAIAEAISFAHENEVVVIAAAGNGGAAAVDYPARIGDVFAVSAVDLTNTFAEFANRGSGLNLVAPGVDLIGAVPLSLDAAGTARWSGTSFAAPLVAGTAALLRARDPLIREDKIREA